MHIYLTALVPFSVKSVFRYAGYLVYFYGTTTFILPAAAHSESTIDDIEDKKHWIGQPILVNTTYGGY
ncbi:MAG: hypothetical protein U0X76_04810 [Bacteroidia bacterium]